MNWILDISIFMVMLGLGFSTIRVFSRANYSNKILGADFMMTSLVAMFGVVSVYTGSLFYLDVAMLVAIIGFLSTVYFADYLAKESVDNKSETESEHEESAS